MTTYNMAFEWALRAIKDGKIVSRAKWLCNVSGGDPKTPIGLYICGRKDDKGKPVINESGLFIRRANGDTTSYICDKEDLLSEDWLVVADDWLSFTGADREAVKAEPDHLGVLKEKGVVTP